jgi:hypothetical protein
VALAGDRVVYGFSGQVMGPLDAELPLPHQLGRAGVRVAKPTSKKAAAKKVTAIKAAKKGTRK